MAPLILTETTSRCVSFALGLGEHRERGAETFAAMEANLILCGTVSTTVIWQTHNVVGFMSQNRLRAVPSARSVLATKPETR